MRGGEVPGVGLSEVTSRSPEETEAAGGVRWLPAGERRQQLCENSLPTGGCWWRRSGEGWCKMETGVNMPTNVLEVVEKIKPLIQPLTAQERLAVIQEIAAITLSLFSGDPLADEQAQWFALPKSERQQHPGEYIAVHKGKIVDHDPDQRQLYIRIRKRFGSAKVLLVHTDWDQPPTFTFHSPQIERA